MASAATRSVGQAAAGPRQDQAADRVRVLVVEPLDDQRSAMLSALEDAGFEVRAEADGGRIERAVAEFRPDLAVLNVWFRVPPCGYTMTRILRRSTDLPTLLVLRKEDDVDMRLFGLEAGADQLIFQPFSTDELVARARAILRRTGHAGGGTLQVGDLVIDEGAGTATRRGAPLHLTRREFELLVVLARDAGRVVSKQRLSTLAWGAVPWGASTLAMHVSGLRRKLEAHGPPLVRTVRGVGYRLQV